MTETEHEGTTLERLDRIECKLDAYITEHDRIHETERDLRARVAEAACDQALDTRALQDWQIGVDIYLRQAKWAVALAAGAFLVGVVNMLLKLATP